MLAGCGVKGYGVKGKSERGDRKAAPKSEQIKKSLTLRNPRKKVVEVNVKKRSRNH